MPNPRNPSKPRSQSVFKEDQDRRLLTVLLLGETGSGKSTLINYIANYFDGGTPSNPRTVAPTPFNKAGERNVNKRRNTRGRKRSKDHECISYNFQMEGQSYRFIDTPGLSDACGTECETDDINTISIMEAAEKAGTLAAVALVINGSCSRATANVCTTLSRLRGIVPDVFIGNLMVVLTNCHINSYNFDFEALHPWEIDYGHIFFMNNSALRRDSTLRKINDHEVKDMGRDWDNSMHELDILIHHISQLRPQSTAVFKKVRQYRRQLKNELSGLALQINNAQKKQEELAEVQRTYRQATEEVTKHRHFMQTKMVEHTELVPSKHRNVVCLTHTKTVCYCRRNVDIVPHTAGDPFASYPFMSKGKCKNCGCNSGQHYLARVELVKMKTRSVDIIPEIKASYDSAKQQAEDAAISLRKLQQEITVLQTASHGTQSKVQQCGLELQSICGAFTLTDELNAVSFSLETDARSLTSITSREQADDKIRSFKKVADRFQSKNRSESPCSNHYSDIDSKLARRLRTGFRQARMSEPCSSDDTEERGRTHINRNGYLPASIPSQKMASDPDGATHIPQKRTSDHVCPDFNKGMQCSRRPCTFKHQCIVCDGFHGVIECRNVTSTQGAPSQSEPSMTPMEMPFLEQMKVQMDLLQLIQFLMIRSNKVQ